MKITVGLFNDSYPPVMDGVANTVQNYAYWINKKLGKCFVITPKFPNYVDKDEYEVIRYISTRLPMRPPYRLGMPMFDFQTKRLLKKIQFDLIHVHSPFSSGQMALKIAKKRNIPIVATFHSKFYDDFKQALKSDLLAKVALKKVMSFFEKVDYVWTVNNGTAQTLRDYGFQGRIEIMPNGTEYDSEMNEEENNALINEKYHLDNDTPVLLFVGQHIWQKNLRLIIETLSALKKENYRFKMLFVGEGYAKDDLEALVHEYGLDEVQFVGKILDRDLLKRVFARADLFLFPSVYDNAPIVIKEAAALGTPSVVVGGTNAQEGIIDGYNGFVCENDLESLKEKIKFAMSDREKLRHVGINAKLTLSESWENVIDKASKRYLEIIEEHQKKMSRPRLKAAKQEE